MLENLAYCLNATAPIFLLMLLGLPLAFSIPELRAIPRP